MAPTASKDHPRILRKTRTGETVRCTDPAEYLTATTAAGYRDVTDEAGSAPRSGRSGRSSSSSSSSARSSDESGSTGSGS